jgi:hypothetical protein
MSKVANIIYYAPQAIRLRFVCVSTYEPSLLACECHYARAEAVALLLELGANANASSKTDEILLHKVSALSAGQSLRCRFHGSAAGSASFDQAWRKHQRYMHELGE